MEKEFQILSDSNKNNVNKLCSYHYILNWMKGGKNDM